MDSWEQIATLSGHRGLVLALATHNDRLVSGSDDRCIRVWRMGSWECERILTGHNGGVVGVCIVQGPSQRRNACGLVALPRLPVCALSTVTVLTRHRHTAFVPHRHRPSVQAPPSPSRVLSPPLAAHASLVHLANLGALAALA